MIWHLTLAFNSNALTPMLILNIRTIFEYTLYAFLYYACSLKKMCKVHMQNTFFRMYIFFINTRCASDMTKCRQQCHNLKLCVTERKKNGNVSTETTAKLFMQPCGFCIKQWHIADCLESPDSESFIRPILSALHRRDSIVVSPRTYRG